MAKTALRAYTTVLVILRVKRTTMEAVCQEIVNRLEGENPLFSSQYWLCDDAWQKSWTTAADKSSSRRLKLEDIVRMAYDLCDAIRKDYTRHCKEMLSTLRDRVAAEGEEVDGGGTTTRISEFVKGEMYLRRLNLCLKSQGFLGEVDDASYVGSRQQCLYGCVCFVYLLFEMCGNFDFVGVDGIDWLMQTVFDGGCSSVGRRKECTSAEGQLLGMVGSTKPIVACIFDLVNTKNPSGGMVGPGNCKWFHDLVLRLSGTVDPWYNKMMKNHAALHDAFGFLINRVNVGPGYTFGYYGKNVMRGSGSMWSRCCFMGQLSGLYAVRKLMKYIPDLPLSFTSFDTYDETERGRWRS